jgi:S1-C subfamily serine protease
MRSNAPRLGVIPNYADENDGVLLDGVSENGPAAKAGLKAGDRIISLGGKPVRNVNSYMVLMGTQKKGDTLEVVVTRKGEKVTLKVVLE